MAFGKGDEPEINKTEQVIEYVVERPVFKDVEVKNPVLVDTPIINPVLVPQDVPQPVFKPYDVPVPVLKHYDEPVPVQRPVFTDVPVDRPVYQDKVVINPVLVDTPIKIERVVWETAIKHRDIQEIMMAIKAATEMLAPTMYKDREIVIDKPIFRDRIVDVIKPHYKCQNCGHEV